MDKQIIMAVIDALNQALKMLPDTISCSIEDLYPDFDDPECGPEVYLALLEEEARAVKVKVGLAEESQRELLQRLLVLLVGCAIVLRLAGVGLENDDEQEEIPPSHLTGEAETDADSPDMHNGHHPN